MEILVVGSGPSGHALIDRILEKNKNYKITLVDGDDSTLTYKKDDQRDLYKELDKSENFYKNFYGKDIISFHKCSDERLLYSMSTGGLSNLWSAASFTYNKNFFKKKRVDINLNPYYEKIFLKNKFIHKKDKLFKKFNNYKTKKSDFKFTKIINKFIMNINKSKDFLAGNSILMVDDKCNKCNLCNIGCPYDYIYNTRLKIDQLIERKSIKYLKNLKLLEFNENNKKVQCYFLDSKQKRVSLIFDKIFIGAGPLNTTKIVAKSLNLKKKINIRETRSFNLPIFFLKSIDKYENNISLPECFIVDLKNPYKVFYQASYNPKFLKYYLKRNYLLFKLMPDLILNQICKRVLIIWGYLDTKNNSKILYDPVNEKFTYENKIIDTKLINRFIKKINSFSFFTHKKLLKISKIGESNHLGSSFSMGNDPIKFIVNSYGKINKFQNCYIIDSSILPDIAPGPLTLTVMANSMRVGDHALHEE